MSRPSRTSFAILGEVPREFGRRLAEIGPRRSFESDHAGAADPRNEIAVLFVGETADRIVLATRLPSLRTLYPTMDVVGVGSGSNSFPADLQGWVDGVLVTELDRANYLDGLARRAGALHALPRAIESVTRRLAGQTAAILVLFFLWWLAVAAFGPPAYLLPSPVRVLDQFLLQPDRFVLHLLITAWEALLGFGVGNGLAVVIAVLLHRFVAYRRLTMPVLISIQAIPIVAFAPLLSVWLGTGLAAKVAMAAIICFFPTVVNLLQAFASVDREFVELFRLFQASYPTALRRLLFPASTPAIIAALKISAGLAVVGAIVAEMTGANRGLGYLILNGAFRLETDVMFVAMLLSGALGIVFHNMPEVLRLALPAAWRRGLPI